MKASKFRPYFWRSGEDDPRYPALIKQRNDCAAAVIHPRSFFVYLLSWEAYREILRDGHSPEWVKGFLKRCGFTVWHWQGGSWEAL